MSGRDLHAKLDAWDAEDAEDAPPPAPAAVPAVPTMPRVPTLDDLRQAAVKMLISASIPGGSAAADFISPLVAKYEADYWRWWMAQHGVA